VAPFEALRARSTSVSEKAYQKTLLFLISTTQADKEEGMRGKDEQQLDVFSCVSTEEQGTLGKIRPQGGYLDF
jgi:hypothetical protein